MWTVDFSFTWLFINQPSQCDSGESAAVTQAAGSQVVAAPGIRHNGAMPHVDMSAPFGGTPGARQGAP